MNWKAAVTYFLSDHFTKRVWQTILITCSMKIVRQVWQTIMNAVRLILAASKKMKNLHSETRKRWKIPFRTGFSIVRGIFLFFCMHFFCQYVCSVLTIFLLYFSIQLNEITNSLKKTNHDRYMNFLSINCYTFDHDPSRIILLTREEKVDLMSKWF